MRSSAPVSNSDGPRSTVSISTPTGAVHRRDQLAYDVLVIASGARLLPEETEGLIGPGWGERVHTFYSLTGALRSPRRSARFTGGRLVVNVIDMPIKCPVAPLEFCFLADWFFRQKGIRDDVELT